METKLPRELVERFPKLTKAWEDGPIAYEEAVAILASVVGTEGRAEEFLRAHKRRGLAVDGHEALARR